MVVSLLWHWQRYSHGSRLPLPHIHNEDYYARFNRYLNMMNANRKYLERRFEQINDN